MATTAQLFSADATDQPIALGQIDVSALEERQLLWIDLASASPDELAEVSRILGWERRQLDLLPDGERPGLVNYGDHFRARARVVSLGRSNEPLVSNPLTLLVGRNVVVTVHAGESAFLDRLRKRERGDSSIGALSAESFSASVLGWLLDSYFRALDVLVRDIDRVEVVILGRRQPPQHLALLVAARRRISDLRRLLKTHRDLFFALARPDFMATGQADTQPYFDALTQHYERAEDDVETARDLVVGSFELLSTRAAQRTNDTMQVLTFVTVLMGVLGLAAGLLGMNFELPMFSSGVRGFLWVIAGMAGFSTAAVLLALRRGWF